eukprot:97689-Amphidinium_carterae.1
MAFVRLTCREEAKKDKKDKKKGKRPACLTSHRVVCQLLLARPSRQSAPIRNSASHECLVPGCT